MRKPIGTNVTQLFEKNVLREGDNIDLVLYKFSRFVHCIMHNPKEYYIWEEESDDKEIRVLYWTAGRKYHSKNIGFVEDYENVNSNIHGTLSLYKYAKEFTNFFEYLLRITKERTMITSRKDLNLYKDAGRRKYFNGDPDSAFTHNTSYIETEHCLFILDFMNIYDDSSCGAYIVSMYFKEGDIRKKK